MSYTEIYKFNKKGNAKYLGEVKNAMQGALIVWDVLEKKYLPSDGTPRFISGKLSEVWALADDHRLSREEKICILCTFDMATVNKDNLPDLIRCFKAFDAGSNLPKQASVIEAAINDSDLIAIAFNQTSVNVDSWGNNFGERKRGKDIPYNILKMQNHFDVYDELNKSNSKK